MSGDSGNTVGHVFISYARKDADHVDALQGMLEAVNMPGFQVSDGNTRWYQIASSPWDGNFYASADAFYNDGRTSGSLAGTPFYDPPVPVCPG